MEHLTCRAASGDNSFDVRSIIELFEAVYGDSYPLPGVYDEQFWRRHIGKRFTSLLIFDGRKLVGHLAAQPECQDGKMVQILFPLCHPDALENFDEISTLAWQTFENQALRQQWQGIYYFAFADVPDMVRLGEQVLRVKSIAICPAYFPPCNLQVHGNGEKRKRNTKQRADIIIGQRLFAPERDKQRSVYIGEEHSELTSKIYKALKLPREIRTSATKAKLASYPLPADRSAIETRFFAKSNIMHAYIEPSLLVNDAELAAHFVTPHSESTFVFVKAYDPRALESAYWLEQHGFEFSGVLPFIHDRESLLFSHTSVESSERLDAETVLSSRFSAW